MTKKTPFFPGFSGFLGGPRDFPGAGISGISRGGPGISRPGGKFPGPGPGNFPSKKCIFRCNFGRWFKPQAVSIGSRARNFGIFWPPDPIFGPPGTSGQDPPGPRFWTPKTPIFDDFGPFFDPLFAKIGPEKPLFPSPLEKMRPVAFFLCEFHSHTTLALQSAC